MLNVIIPVKAVGENLPLLISFADMLQFGESINGCSSAVTVFSGADPNPSALLTKAPTNTAQTMTQEVTGGVAGVTYSIAFLVTGTNSHNYVKVGRLSVVGPDQAQWIM